MLFHGSRIHTRIILGILLILTITLVGSGYVILSKQRQQLNLYLDRQGRQLAVLLAKTSVVPIRQYRFFLLQQFAAKVEQFPQVAYCEIYDDARVSLVQADLNLKNQSIKKKTRRVNESIRIYTEPILHEKEFLGSVEIGLYTHIVKKELKETTLQLALAFLLTISLVALLLYLFILRLLVTPVVKLSQLTQNIASGHFVTAPVPKRKDEIGELYLNFNSMSQQLANSFALIEKNNRELEQRIRKRTNDLVKAKEAALSAAQAKTDFLANMSHEIRTPMNGVIASADLAIMETSDENVLKYLRIIHESGHALLGIINDILDFSKIEAGKLDLEYVPFSPENLIMTVTELFSNQIQEKKINFVLDISAKTPLWLLGDSLRIQQILINLIGNALKFSYNDSIIILRMYPKEDQETLHFSVTDQGIGIKPEKLKTLFDPFTQADSSTTREYGGTGLGLSISKRLVSLMGGVIYAESNYGQGATFHFNIKMEHDPQRKEQQTSADLVKPFKNLRVLLIDAVPETRQIMTQLLESMNFKVSSSTGASGDSLALETAASTPSPPQVLIADHATLLHDQALSTLNFEQDFPNAPPTILLTPMGKTPKINPPPPMKVVLLPKPFTPLTIARTICQLFDHPIDDQISKANPSDADTLPLDASELDKCRILLVEDNPTNQNIACAVLNLAAIEMEVTNNGQEAIEALKAKPFDMVLMDIQMPVMDGFEATRIIREELHLDDLPIIAMTAYAMPGDRNKCLQAGMNDYITKPIERETIFKTLSRFVSSNVNATFKPAKTLKKNDPIESVLPDSLPGIHIQSAMEKLELKPSAYMTIISGFMHMNQDLKDQIQTVCDSGQRQALFNIAHALKGSSASIGAAKLSQIALSIESACKKETAQATVISLVKEMQNALTEVLTSIKSLVDTNKAPEPAPPVTIMADPEKTKALCQELQSALKMMDPMQSQAVIAQLGSYLPPKDREKIKTAIDNYDFEAAALYLSQTMADLGADNSE